MIKLNLKGLLSAAALLIGSLGGIQAQLVEEGTSYTLRLDGTEYYLSAETAAAGANAELCMQSIAADGFDQAFIFTAATGGYNINVGDRLTLVREQWYMRYKNTADVDLTSNDAIFAVEESGPGIRLKNLGSGKYVGCDSKGAGRKVYSDKSGDAVITFIVEEVSGDIFKDKLSGDITAAEELLASTVVGDEEGQYSEAARQALADAIASARQALEGDAEAMKNAINVLAGAVDAYNGSRVPAAFRTGNYRFAFKGIEGTYLSNGWHANSWESSNTQPTGLFLNESTDYNQEYKVMRTAPGAAVNGYNLRDKNGCYLYNKNGALRFDDSKTLDPRTRDAVFFFETEGDYVRIVSAATGHYVGPNDNTKGWTWIHAGTDYTGEADGCLYTAEFLGTDAYEDLAAAIAMADALMASTEEGDQAGQYPSEARLALSEAIAKARTALTGEDLEAMAAAVTELTAAMDEYKAAEIVAEPIEAGVYMFYHKGVEGAVLASGWHANSWESGNVENTGLIVNESEVGDYNTEFSVVEAPAGSTEDAFNILDNTGAPMVNSNGKLLVGANVALDDINALFAIGEINGEVRIRSLATGKNVGPVDDTKGWNWIHAGTNHSGTEGGDVFIKKFIRITTGVDEVAASAACTVSAANGAITVTGAEYTEIHDVTGVRVAAFGGDASMEFARGIYVVTVRTATACNSVKILVK